MISLSRAPLTFTLLFLLLGCAAGGASRPEWTSAPDTDVAAYATFAWQDAGSDRPRTIMDTQIRESVRTALLAKGYRETDAAADLVLSWDAVAHETAKGSSPLSIGIGIGSWGSNVGGSVGASVPVGGSAEPRLEQRIALRAVDPKGNREVWIGRSATLPESPDAEQIERAVANLMKGFPERRQ